MPLDEFVAAVIALLEAAPDAKEIQVERVKFLRYGEARGDYDQVVKTLNASDPTAGPLDAGCQPERLVSRKTGWRGASAANAASGLEGITPKYGPTTSLSRRT
jgi:hypothetical protein